MSSIPAFSIDIHHTHSSFEIFQLPLPPYSKHYKTSSNFFSAVGCACVRRCGYASFGGVHPIYLFAIVGLRKIRGHFDACRCSMEGGVRRTDAFTAPYPSATVNTRCVSVSVSDNRHVFKTAAGGQNADLMMIADRWSSLPECIRLAILALI